MPETRDIAAIAPLPDVRRRMNDGAALIAAGKAEDAIDLFRQAGTLQPDYPDAPLMEGVAYFLLGDPTRAEALLERALKLAPARADILQNIGLVRGALGRTDAELAAYNEALASEPRNPALHELLAQAQLRAGLAKAAVVTLSDLLIIDPDNRGARHNLALALIEAPYTSWTRERELLLLALLMQDDVERQTWRARSLLWSATSTSSAVATRPWRWTRWPPTICWSQPWPRSTSPTRSANACSRSAVHAQ